MLDPSRFPRDCPDRTTQQGELMRPDRALEIALRPGESDRGTLVAALVALRLGYQEQERRLGETEKAVQEAGNLRRERADVDGRLDAALILGERDAARLAEVLAHLDTAAPDEARRLRAGWGIWDVQPK